MDDTPCQFGRYELLELLATGGMAQIYRARLVSAEGTAKELVIKRVLPHLAENRDFIEMFIDEATITLPLNHGNIVQVYEFGQEGRDYFLAMEWVRGRNLETVLTRLKELGRLIPIEMALFIASETAKGLDYAHRFRDPHDRPTKIIHRDVSPQNILVGFQGEIKLTDFGIAKARSRIRQTAQGIIRGKACYLSPEQAECKSLDSRSDQFSLGSVVYELLTGVRPFEGETEVGTLEKVRRARVDPPSSLRPEIPVEIDQAILKTLELDPNRRFEGCANFHVVLSRKLQEISPEFTSSTIADWMRRQFAQEITREVAARTTKERLLEQLSKENSSIDASKLTTGEILKMGTVSMTTDEGDEPKRHRLWWLITLSIVSILGLGALVGWPLISGTGTTTGHDLDGDAGVEGDGLVEEVNGGQADGHSEDLAGISPDARIEALSDAHSNAWTEEPVVSSADGRAGAPADKPSERPADLGPAAKAADSPAPIPIRYGYLNLNSSPWALVEIDGRKLEKETPLFKVRVRAGKHRLRFFNPELKIEKVIPVVVRANRTKTITVKLNQP